MREPFLSNVHVPWRCVLSSVLKVADLHVRVKVWDPFIQGRKSLDKLPRGSCITDCKGRHSLLKLNYFCNLKNNAYCPSFPLR